MVSIYLYYFYYFLLCRNIQTKIVFWNFYVFLARGIGQWVPAFPIVLTLPVGLFPIWVSWPLARGSFAYSYLGYYFFYYFLLCTIIWNIQIKIAFWNFDVFFTRGIGQWVPASPIVLTLPVGLLPSWVSCLRISFLSRLLQILRLRN